MATLNILTWDYANNRPVVKESVSYFGSIESPRTITAANGITVADGHMSNKALEQFVFIQGPTDNTNTEITASQPIDSHTIIGAKMWIVGCSDTQQFTIPQNGTALKINGDLIPNASSLTLLIWTGSDWRQQQ